MAQFNIGNGNLSVNMLIAVIEGSHRKCGRPHLYKLSQGQSTKLRAHTRFPIELGQGRFPVPIRKAKIRRQPGQGSASSLVPKHCFTTPSKQINLLISTSAVCLTSAACCAWDQTWGWAFWLAMCLAFSSASLSQRKYWQGHPM